MDRLTAAGYVAGIIDGEGSISTTVKHRAVRVGNTDPAILDAYEEALVLLGIQFTRTRRSMSRTPRHQPIETTTIFGRRNLEIVLRDVPIQAPDKQRRLREAVGSFVLPSYYRKHEVKRERIEELIELGLTEREMAERLGMRSHSNVEYYLRKFGLRTKLGQQRLESRACGLL